MTQAKICGLRTPQALAAAVAGQASHIGLMFFEKSPRNISAADAAHLVEPIRGRGIRIVAVVVDPDDGMVDHLMAVLNPDLIQLHGHESVARAGEIAARAGVGVIKALAVGSAHDLDTARAYEAVVDHLMFEAPASPERPGGNGVAFDWGLLAGRRFAKPWFLAGGLDPWNVADAIGLSGAPLVDVSSGVERGPGLKDPALISAFLDAVARA